MFKRFLVVASALLFLVGCTSDKGFNFMGTPTANQLFKDYYAAVTGTMSASVHHDEYQWRDSYEPFPYMEEAKWTDFDLYITSCDNKDIARFDGMYDTYEQGLGYSNPREATDRVAAYWQSQGWEVSDISLETYPEMRQILTVTDTNINLLYTASVRGEAIEASTACIPELYDPENPVEEPITYRAIQPADLTPTPSTTPTGG